MKQFKQLPKMQKQKLNDKNITLIYLEYIRSSQFNGKRITSTDAWLGYTLLNLNKLTAYNQLFTADYEHIFATGYFS